MIQAILIAVAGGLGTLARYGIGTWAGRALGDAFPYGTMIVNVAGCFLMALVAQLASLAVLSPALRLTLMTGFLGGLTTYSSFNYETTRMLRSGAWALAAANVGLTLAACFAAGLLGLIAASRLAGR